MDARKVFGWHPSVDVGNLVGKTLISASGAPRDNEMVFLTNENEQFVFYHDQDCCETVAICDVVGDLNDLVGSPIVRAEERTSSASGDPGVYESGTWTFYEFATNKGSVTVRWLGESSGYYSESVSMMVEKIND